ncbi:MAG TPA: hypothetical protein ENO12_01185, partial [Thermoplasmatales archaeon]|nr:hypothetical protein [Thermoplasmatales archaeon]
MKHKNIWLIAMLLGSLLLIATIPAQAADITISDSINDVSSIDYLTGETIVVTSHPEINVENIDITKAEYTQEGATATVSLQVKGNIENRGKIIDPESEDFFEFIDAVEYGVQLITSDEDYMISYSNGSGQLLYG